MGRSEGNSLIYKSVEHFNIIGTGSVSCFWKEHKKVRYFTIGQDSDFAIFVFHNKVRNTCTSSSENHSGSISSVCHSKEYLPSDSVNSQNHHALVYTSISLWMMFVFSVCCSGSLCKYPNRKKEHLYAVVRLLKWTLC